MLLVGLGVDMKQPEYFPHRFRGFPPGKTGYKTQISNIDDGENMVIVRLSESIGIASNLC